MRSVFIFITLLSVSFLYSCEKVIEVPLRDADSRLVIEANLSNELGSCIVKISRVVNFSAPNEFPEIGDAIINLKDNQGNAWLIPEISNGTYALADFQGIPGRTYTLEVFVDGELHLSTCKMPVLVELDSVVPRAQFFFGDTTIFAGVYFKDPPSTPNYYRFIYTLRDTIEKAYFLGNDQLLDGQNIEINIASFEREALPGDTVTIELWSIDKPVYTYFQTLSSIVGGTSGQEIAPANPVSNISGGVLGYFSAYSVSRKGMRIPL